MMKYIISMIVSLLVAGAVSAQYAAWPSGGRGDTAKGSTFGWRANSDTTTATENSNTRVDGTLLSETNAGGLWTITSGKAEICYTGADSGVAMRAKYSVKSTSAAASTYRVSLGYSNPDGSTPRAVDTTPDCDASGANINCFGIVKGRGLHPAKSVGTASLSSGMSQISSQQLLTNQCYGLVVEIDDDDDAGTTLSDSNLIVEDLIIWVDVDPAHDNRNTTRRLACNNETGDGTSANRLCADWDIFEVVAENAGGKSKMSTGIFGSGIGGIYIAGGPTGSSHDETDLTVTDPGKANQRILIGRTNPADNLTDIFNGLQMATVEVVGKSLTTQALAGVAWEKAAYSRLITARNGNHTVTPFHGSSLFTHGNLGGVEALGKISGGTRYPVAVLVGDQGANDKGWMVVRSSTGVGGGIGVSHGTAAAADPAALLTDATMISNDGTSSLVSTGNLFIDANKNGTLDATERYVAPLARTTQYAMVPRVCYDDTTDGANGGGVNGFDDGDACCAHFGMTCENVTAGGTNGARIACDASITDGDASKGYMMAFCY